MFAGRKFLHSFELRPGRVSLDDLLASCQRSGLTGFAEVKLSGGAGMIVYYFGNEVNVIYREGNLAFHGAQAFAKLRAQIATLEGSVSVYELPMDAAHLLRGISNRRKLGDPLASVEDLQDLLTHLETDLHTGIVEIQTEPGTALLLIVAGRLSNTYWETSGGATFEKGEARERLDAALRRGVPAAGFVSEFSREAWRSRSATPGEAAGLRPSERPEALPAEQMADEEAALRARTLERVQSELPSMTFSAFIDLYTGATVARRVRGHEAIPTALLAEKLPSFLSYLRDVIEAGADELLAVEISSRDAFAVAVLSAPTREVLVMISDRSQPASQIHGTLVRAVERYARQALATRGAPLVR